MIYHYRKQRACQPNFRQNVTPDPAESCGPYAPASTTGSSGRGQAAQAAEGPGWPLRGGHDTIAMLAVDASGSVAAGCSTNGAIHKVPGRVGDGSIPGGGAYADSEAGACGATGDGDTALRFLPCYQVVESMRLGAAPAEAAAEAVARIARRAPGYVGAVVALDVRGRHGAACHGWPRFQYSLRSAATNGVEVVEIECAGSGTATAR